MRPRYIHEDEGKLILAHKRWRVHYMSTVERESSRIRVWHGKIFDSKGRLIAGSLEGQGKSFLYVMDEAGNIYISSNLEAVARFHHSSFLGGKNVAAAGVLRIRNGEIVYLNNDSGHYWPPRFCLSQAMDQLRFDGADTGKIKVKDVTDTF